MRARLANQNPYVIVYKHGVVACKPNLIRPVPVEHIDLLHLFILRIRQHNAGQVKVVS